MKAVGLKSVAFRPGSSAIDWITVALKTITPEHRDLQQVMIYVPYHLMPVRVCADVRQFFGEAACQQWLDLDCLLVQFWESRSIRPRMIRTTSAGEGRDMRGCIGLLTPEATRRGIIDVVE